MTGQPFYFEIKSLLTQFVTAFNQVVINRYDKDQNVTSKLKVAYAYAPKKKVLHDLVNKAQTIALPAISVNITNIARDQSRVFNKNLGSYYTGRDRKGYFVPQPCPVNISVDMNIMTTYQSDMDQIISNFLPFNDPYIVICTRIPAEILPSQDEIRHNVLWNGNIGLKYPIEQQATSPARVIATTGFTIHGWIFKSVPAEQPSNIYKINSNFIPVSGFEYE